MLKVMILHGWHGSELPHWQAWLAQQLAVENCAVAFIQLPDNMNPKKEVWIKETKTLYDEFMPDIVIAHSLGNILWFHLCGQIAHRARKLLLCAVPRDLSSIPEVADFFPSPTPKDLHAEDIVMVASDDDPYMSAKESSDLARILDVPLMLLSGAGHINAASGYGEWPWVKEWALS